MVMRKHHSSPGLIVAPLIAGIAWVAIPLLSLAGTFVSADLGRNHIITETISNSAVKSDRGIAAHPQTEQMMPNAGPPNAKRTWKIPSGCEAAFSKLLKSNNFAVRCVTSIQPRVKLA
jgi:hypothetical protein